MNSLPKPLLLGVAILGLALQSNFARGETNAESKTGESNQAHRAKDSPSDQKPDPDHPVVALQGPALFKRLDTDQDGHISLAEFVAYGKTEDRPTVRGKNSVGGSGASGAASDDSDQARRIKDNPPYHKNEPAAAVPKPPSPGPSVLPSATTRESRFTAEVFEILDIDHDHFLTQKELDALVGAHQISQP